MAKEIGWSGTEIFSGTIDEDYNNKLQFPQSIDVYDQMRKGDGTVGAVLKVVKLLIINGNYFVSPASEEKKDIEIADFVRTQFFERIEWVDFLKGVLLSFDFGFMVFEKVFEIDGNKIFYKKLAQRLPKSIENWLTENKYMEDKNHPGIEQNILSDIDPSKNGKNVMIPGKKIFRYTLDQEGDNYDGVSLLRTAYKHWFMKEKSYKLQLLASERNGVGLPVARHTIDIDIKTAEKTEITNTLKGLRANEKAHLIEPYGWEFRFESPNSQFDFEPQILHHDREITKSVLAQFLELGVTKGALSQSESDQDLFLKAVMAGVGSILSKINKELVKEIVMMNFDGVENFPKIDVAGIERDDVEKLSNAISSLASSGFLTADNETEIFLRKKMKLPEIDINEERDRTPKKKESDTSKEEKKKADDKKKEEEKKKLTLSNLAVITPTKRETDYIKEISRNEKIITAGFSRFEKELEKMNNGLTSFIKKKYKEFKTVDKNGELHIARTGNSGIQKEISNKVNEDWTSFSKEWGSTEFAKSLVDAGFSRGEKSLKKLSSVGWAVRGFRFNIGKVLRNAPVNINERINDHIGTEAVLTVAIAAIKDIVDKSVNKNTAKLSYETYPRSSFKQAIADDNKDVERFKMVLPEGEVARLLKERPEGFSISNVFKILTISEWAKLREDDNGNPIIFPIHPNSKDYYLPILKKDNDKEEEISKEQRGLINKAKEFSIDRDIRKIFNASKTKKYPHNRPKTTKEEDSRLSTILEMFSEDQITVFDVIRLVKDM